MKQGTYLFYLKSNGLEAGHEFLSPQAILLSLFEAPETKKREKGYNWACFSFIGIISHYHMRRAIGNAFINLLGLQFYLLKESALFQASQS